MVPPRPPPSWTPTPLQTKVTIVGENRSLQSGKSCQAVFGTPRPPLPPSPPSNTSLLPPPLQFLHTLKHISTNV